MRKILSLIFACLLLLPLCSSCAKVTIPNSGEAEQKLKALGYSVSMDLQYGDMLAVYEITQVTILSADKDGEFIQVYFFANEEDTETFYKDRARSLSSGVEVLKKNKYSIYRGTQKAVDDFLS